MNNYPPGSRAARAHYERGFGDDRHQDLEDRVRELEARLEQAVDVLESIPDFVLGHLRIEALINDAINVLLGRETEVWPPPVSKIAIPDTCPACGNSTMASDGREVVCATCDYIDPDKPDPPPLADETK